MKDVFEQWSKGKIAVQCDTELQAKTFLLLVANHPFFDLEDELQFWDSTTPCISVNTQQRWIETWGRGSAEILGHKEITFDEFIEEYWKVRSD